MMNLKEWIEIALPSTYKLDNKWQKKEDSNFYSIQKMFGNQIGKQNQNTYQLSFDQATQTNYLGQNEHPS